LATIDLEVWLGVARVGILSVFLRQKSDGIVRAERMMARAAVLGLAAGGNLTGGLAEDISAWAGTLAIP